MPQDLIPITESDLIPIQDHDPELIPIAPSRSNFEQDSGRMLEAPGDTVASRILPWLQSKVSAPLVNVDPDTVLRWMPALSILGRDYDTGAAKGIADVVSGLTTPENLAIGAASALQPEIAAGLFSGLGAKAAGESLGEASVAQRTGNKEEASRQGVNALAAGLQALVAPIMGGGGRLLHEALGKRSEPPILPYKPSTAVPEVPISEVDLHPVSEPLPPTQNERLSEPVRNPEPPVEGRLPAKSSTPVSPTAAPNVSQRPMLGTETTVEASAGIANRNYSPAKRMPDGTILVGGEHGEFPEGGERGYMTPEGEFLSLMDVARKESAKGMKIKLAGEEGGFIRLPPFLRPKTTAPIRDAVVDFQPKEAANAEFSRKFAAERIPILGRALGGKSRIETPQDEAIAAWYAERHGVGPAIASALGERIRGEVNDAFKADASGDLNVAGAGSKKISDVFEGLQRDPNAYQLTPVQARVYQNIIKPVMERMNDMVTRYDVVEPKDQYFMRGKVTSPTDAPMGGRGNRVGAKQGFQKERMFDTEAEGWQQGFKYGTDVEQRLVQGVESMYRAIADKRLSTDPVLGGRTRGQLMAELRLANPEMSREQIRRIANSVQSNGSVYSPAFFGKIFKPEVAEMLKREFTAEETSLRKVLADVNSFTKATQLGLDFGVGQIQLLPMLYNRPDIWAKSQARAMASFVTPDAFSAYARNNMTYVKELAEHGSSVGRSQEYMQGTGEVLPRMLEKIPVVGGALAEIPKAFSRYFQTALDVAKVEMWKAWRDVTPRAEWGKTIQSIESVLLSGRMESSMVPRNRALLERVALLAPSYYRGAVNFIGALGESGVSGKVARNAMGRFITGSIATYYAAGYMLGMDNETLAKRLNPGGTDFMMWTMKDGEKSVNIGLGGIFRSFLRLGGSMVQTSREHPGSWTSLTSEKNPLVRWYRGHAGPVVSFAWNKFSGKDFLGADSDLKGSLKDIAPLATRSKSKREAVAQILGLNTQPAKAPTAEDVAKQLFGKDASVDELSRVNRLAVAKKMGEQKAERSPEETKRAAEKALEYSFERQKELKAALSGEHQKFLEKNKIVVPGYEAQETVGRRTMTFTEKEKATYVEALKKQYAGVVEKLMQDPTFENLSQSQKEKRASARFSSAKARALGELHRSKSGVQ